MSLRALRRWLAAGLLLTLAVAGFLLAGRLVTRVDPLEKSDVIYVLAGSRVDRWLEAVDLYKEGWAPRIVLSPGGEEPGEVRLEARGIHFPNEVDLGRQIMVGQLGIPAAAVDILPNAVDNTAQEADAIRPLVSSGHWTRMIVITDRPNTRRAGYAMRRGLGPNVTVIVRCSRDDDYNPARWWTSRSTFRATFYEVPKLVAYWLGLKG